MYFQQSRTQQGFTLVELIVVIIVIGILSAVAMPKFINLARDSRLAAISALASAVETATFQWNGICQLKRQACDIANVYPNTLNTQGLTVQFSNDFPDAGDNVNSKQIDILISHSGFSILLPDQYNTKFTLDGAPDPANCSVNYAQSQLPSSVPVISTINSGC